MSACCGADCKRQCRMPDPVMSPASQGKETARASEPLQNVPKPAQFVPHDKPILHRGGKIVNAMSVDVEDYFQVQAFANNISRDSWDSRECRVEANTDRILAIFDDAGIKATFFTLGWVAERYPLLVRRIVDQGHELASHGHAHFRADEQTPDAFRDDISRTKKTLEPPLRDTGRQHSPLVPRTCGASTSCARRGTRTVQALIRSIMIFTGCPMRPDLRFCRTGKPV